MMILFLETLADYCVSGENYFEQMEHECGAVCYLYWLFHICILLNNLPIIKEIYTHKQKQATKIEINPEHFF